VVHIAVVGWACANRWSNSTDGDVISALESPQYRRRLLGSCSAPCGGEQGFAKAGPRVSSDPITLAEGDLDNMADK
jgi:hypothetical protein